MKLSVILSYILAFTWPIAVIRAEVYSSASDMKQVFQLEREMVGILGGFASKLHAKLNRINDYLKVRLTFFVSFINSEHHKTNAHQTGHILLLLLICSIFKKFSYRKCSYPNLCHISNNL
jgi:hypothetical protein